MSKIFSKLENWKRRRKVKGRVRRRRYVIIFNIMINSNNNDGSNDCVQ